MSSKASSSPAVERVHDFVAFKTNEPAHKVVVQDGHCPGSSQ